MACKILNTNLTITLEFLSERLGQEQDIKFNFLFCLAECKPSLWNKEKADFASSHHAFQSAFPQGFPWEVLSVLSGRETVISSVWDFPDSFCVNEGRELACFPSIELSGRLSMYCQV